MQVQVRKTSMSCLDLLVWNYCRNHIKFMYTVQWNPWEKRKRWPWVRSIQPKFPEISVQNSMDRFGPTGKLSKKLFHLLRWTTFPGQTGRNFGQIWSIYSKLVRQWEKRCRSGESTRLPPMWPRFKSRCWSHMWVEFVVGSLPCSKRFFSCFSGFPLSSKTNTSKFQFNLESMDMFQRVYKNS